LEFTYTAIPNLFSVQTLASVKAASALDKALPSDRTSPLRVLLQVNTSGEDSKSGLPPLTPSMADLENSELVILAKHILAQCPKLRFEGLMTIGALELSLSASETEKNADFEKLKETRALLVKHLDTTYGEGGREWGEEQSGRLLLSMGMSSDFEAALKSGSDIVRVGTGIFGQRAKKV
jgi:PLP dependent protein